jgi:hypothetical protein
MKLSNVTSKLTSMKSSVVKVLAATALAGAVLVAAAPAAQAQRVVVGVRFGGPRYIAPPVAYGYPVYVGPRYYGWHGRDAYVRHEDFYRGHYGYRHDYRRY